MPAMPRIPGKALKIAQKILKLSPKSQGKVLKKNVDKRLTAEETYRAR